MSNGRSLKDYPLLPQLDILDSLPFQNRFIIDELMYNKEMAKEHAIVLKSLNKKQVHVYEDIMTTYFHKREDYSFYIVLVGQEKLLCGRH